MSRFGGAYIIYVIACNIYPNTRFTYPHKRVESRDDAVCGKNGNEAMK